MVKSVLATTKLMVLVLFLVAFSMVVTVPGSTVWAGATAVARCRDTQLATTGVEASGAAVTTGWVVRYKNVSATACTLTGYPNIVGVNFETGKSFAATHRRNGYIGGWQRSYSGKPKPLPTVVLTARGGVASSMVEYLGASPAPSCPIVTSLWVNVPGGARPFVLKVSTVVCGQFNANPIVPGNAGWAN
ncbi:MAG TPA: DUF4232 domain-containing protein [Acidimicrobiales bacterium]